MKNLAFAKPNNILLLLIIISIISSCTKDGDINQPLDDDVNGSSTQMRITPEIIDTTTPTQTTTFAPTGTFTPVPTKSTEEKEAFIREMYETNGGCDLPCFWGIEPGQDYQSAIDFFSQYAEIEENKYRSNTVNIILLPPAEINPYLLDHWSILIRSKDGKVDSISGRSNYTILNYDRRMDTLLRNLESPDEIWIKIEPEMTMIPSYKLVLMYKEKGAIIWWEGPLQNTSVSPNEITTEICPLLYSHDDYVFFSPYLIFFDPDDALTFQDAADLYEFDVGFIRLSKENTPIEIGCFYDDYINNDEEDCFSLHLR